ncbi:MAG: GDSL-type esterase/lipase family protein [Deltaproteobacteria bacterium]|nr:GDSL-type esterase/lipase family protein [Deltaproteobacteria bacterium]
MGIVLPRIRSILEQARNRLVRIVVWGGLHSSEDRFTARLRTRLQSRYGDGGPGAFAPAPPFPLYRRQGVIFLSSSGVTGIEATLTSRVSPFGAMGMALDLRQEGTIRFAIDRNLHGRVRLFVRSHPLRGGGVARVALRYRDRNVERELSSNQEDSLEMITEIQANEAFEIRASRMRILGVSIEAPWGVVVDSFGIPQGRVDHSTRWDEASFETGLRALAPDIVMLEYGTNEAVGLLPPGESRLALEAFIDRIRKVVPNAPCVVIGPSNYPIQKGKQWFPRPSSGEVRAAFRLAAFSKGCGYVDLIAFQGGESNLDEWFSQGLVLASRVVMSEAGHEKLAEAIERAFTGP